MIFTLYYMYATVLQWWRLGTLRNKINGTLHCQNALLLTTTKTIHDSKKQRSLENLLYYKEDRIACTVVPKQCINLSDWLAFPKDYRLFPIYIQHHKCKLKSPTVHVLIKTMLETYTKHDNEIIQVEKFGDLVAWKAISKFELILKTDLDNLTKLVHCYSNGGIDINHELEIFEIEMISVEGSANKIKYERQYSLDHRMKYSFASVHWNKFATEMKDLYLRIRDATNPKIKIENGTTKTEDCRKVPIYEVKPIKKDNKRQPEDKHTLDVTSSDHRRHKTTDHAKRDRSTDEKHKTEKDRKLKEAKIDSQRIKSKSLPTENVSDKIKDSVADKAKTKTSKYKSETDNKSEKSTSKESTLVNTQDKTEDSPNGTSADAGKRNESSANVYQQLRQSRKSDVVENDTKIRKNDGSKPGVKPCNVESAELPDKKEKQNWFKHSTGDKSAGQVVKPPNILVYADTANDKDNLKSVLRSIVNNDKYVIYDLPAGVSNNPIWSDSTILIIICGSVAPTLTPQILQYLVNGGQLLCLCSDLLHSVLNTFTTAEVREHELVRFSYGEWKRVKMMHHIFCYQASPAKKQFSKDSKDSENSNHSSEGSSPITPRTTPSTAEVHLNGKIYNLQVQVLGAEETWHTPSLLLATVKDSVGKAVFSQVHLEIDPLQYEDDENKYSALKDSNQARLEILKDILSNQLEIDCNKTVKTVNYTPAYFLGRHDLKINLLSECKEIVNDTLVCDKLTMKFYGKNAEPDVATDKMLPILIHSCPSNFSTVDYFSTLDTEHIGKLVIYSDILTSSQLLLAKPLIHGIVVIPRQQSSGIGRSNNIWLSPLGSTAFSLQLHIPLSSPLGRALSLVQQLIAVAIISAIKKLDGYENLNLGIKWPNDIYANGNVKIGGLMVSSTVGNRYAILIVGVGLNLDNPDPTISLNNVIQQYNREHKTSLNDIGYESFFAIVFNEIERIYDIMQNDHLEYFFDLYYKYWMHSDAVVTIQTDKGNSRSAKVMGIDDFGFLKVQMDTGEESVVHPDGNSFDMMKGLIAPKIF